MNTSLLLTCRQSPYDLPYSGLKPENEDGAYTNEKIQSIINLCSEKQALRPDPICHSFCAVIPDIGSMFFSITNRIEDTVNHLFSFDFTASLEADKLNFDNFYQLINEENTRLDEKAKKDLTSFVTKLIMDSSYVTKLGDSLDRSRKFHLKKVLHHIRIMQKPTEKFVSTLSLKVDEINRFVSNDREEDEFPNEYRISAKEYGILSQSSSILRFITILHENEIVIPNHQTVLEFWSQLATLYQRPIFRTLIEKSQRNLHDGDILLVDRLVRQELSHSKFSSVDVLRHLVGGKLAHIGIYINDKEKGLCLSHVNNETNRHSLKVIHDPLYYQFFPSLKLNISSLIPDDVHEMHRPIINEYFCNCFAKLAKIEHPEIPLAEFTAYAKFFFCGHVGYFKNEIDDHEFETTQGEMCSSYVAKVFLKSICSVNEFLKSKGYKFCLQNPFGDYELIDRMDILRLLFHWNKYNIFTVNPVDPMIKKVIEIRDSFELKKTN